MPSRNRRGGRGRNRSSGSRSPARSTRSRRHKKYTVGKRFGRQAGPKLAPGQMPPNAKTMNVRVVVGRDTTASAGKQVVACAYVGRGVACSTSSSPRKAMAAAMRKATLSRASALQGLGGTRRRRRRR